MAGAGDALMAMPPLSLYVHFPWCVRKCPYCDFNSHPARGALPEAEYVAQLVNDLECDLAHVPARVVTSIFLGGGTPSLFSPASVTALLDAIRSRVELSHDVEITLEANPGTTDAERFAGYRRAGVNRLSIGAQSFEPRQLVRLGRIHAATDIDRAIATARAAGFERINLDLMYALPEQRPDHALADLDRAVRCAPTHLSWYQLTIEPRTEFARRPPSLPDENTQAQIEREGLVRLAQAGYSRYEVSAFCRDGDTARHNLNYWTFGDYLGVGAGAHGKLSLADGSIVRTRKPTAPARYLATPASGLSETTPIEPHALPGEFMLNALRLIDGVDTALFTERTGLPAAAIDATCQRLRQRGLLREDRLALTTRGLLFLDSVVSEFL
jgi:putative oxygen-independent coproporphyrinogen III oxidase